MAAPTDCVTKSNASRFIHATNYSHQHRICVCAVWAGTSFHFAQCAPLSSSSSSAHPTGPWQKQKYIFKIRFAEQWHIHVHAERRWREERQQRKPNNMSFNIQLCVGVFVWHAIHSGSAAPHSVVSNDKRRWSAREMESLKKNAAFSAWKCVPLCAWCETASPVNGKRMCRTFHIIIFWAALHSDFG